MSKKIYEKASDADKDLLHQVMAEHHPELDQNEVKVAMTMARKFDKEDEPIPCVKFAGGFAAALARILPAKRRIYDDHEAEIEIDGLVWDNLNMASKKALLDHELNHIRLATDRLGIVKQDDAGRPILKLIPDDWILTGFSDIVRRHGDAALEWQSVSRVYAIATEAHGYHASGGHVSPANQDDTMVPEEAAA